MAKILILLAIVGVIIFFPFFSEAAFSENYKINADVIGTGGATGNSVNYKITDTLGQSVIGLGTGTTYKDQMGLWYMDATKIAILVNSEIIDLGSIIPGTPISSQSVISITTDAPDGYDLYVSQDQPLTHTDTITTIPDFSCTIASPCPWSGIGLGFTVSAGTSVESKWGTDPNFKFAYFPLSPIIIHQKSGFSSGNDQTTVSYKLDTPGTQKSGAYSNIITYTAMERL